MIDITFIWSLPIFLLAVFLCFYIPGKIILQTLKFNENSIFSTTVLSLIVGIVLFGYQGVIFGYLNARWLTYIYIGIFFALWLERVIRNQFRLKRFISTLFKAKKNYLLILIFLLGIFGQVEAFAIAGIPLTDGVHIFTSASDDAFWHTSLIVQLMRRFPPFEPGLVVVQVHNYHYWFNLIIAELIRIFHLPLLPTQFIFFYIMISFLLGSVAFVLAKKLNFSTIGAILLVYLQYFASDMIYLFTFITTHKFVFSIHPLEDGTMLLENPPRALASVVGLASIVFLINWLRTKNMKIGLILALLMASLAGMKINTGAPFLGGLVCVGIYLLFKKQWRMLAIPILAGLISIAIYLPVNAHAGSLIYAPFEMARMFVVQPKLGLVGLELARQIYVAHNNWLQSTRMDVTMLILFMIGQFGIHNFGWIFIKKIFKEIDKGIIIFLYSTIFIAIGFGTFFLQPVGEFDIFNFYLTASLVLSIPAALVLSSLMSNKNLFLRIGIVIIIAAITLPRWLNEVSTIKNYFLLNTKYTNSSIIVHSEELQAMNFIKKNTSKNAVILVLNQGQWDSLYPYVSAFTERDMFLSGQGILTRHGIQYTDREKIVKEIMFAANQQKMLSLLKQNNITLIYSYGPLAKSMSASNLKNIFTNSRISLYSL